MTQANYDPIHPGDVRSAAPVNTIYSSLATASQNLTGVNFAEEGMDFRPFETHPVGLRTGRIIETARPAVSFVVTGGAFAQFVQSGTVFRLNAPAALPAALTANELLRIRARVWLETTLAAGYGLTGAQWSLRLVWNNGAATAQIVFSKRSLIPPPPGKGSDGVLFCEGWLHGPIPVIAWAELQYQLDVAGLAFPSSSMIWATLFRRQNEV